MQSFYSPVEYNQVIAARDQLETAIYLFLLGISPASVHTLAGAAQEVLKGLAKRHARANALPDPVTTLDRTDLTDVPPKSAGQNAVRNYLKHCMAEKHAPVVLSAHLNWPWIYDCIESWLVLGNEHTSATWLFFGWLVERHFVPQYPDDWSNEDCQEFFSEMGRPWPPHDQPNFRDYLLSKLAGHYRKQHPIWFVTAVDSLA